MLFYRSTLSGQSVPYPVSSVGGVLIFFAQAVSPYMWMNRGSL